MRRPSRLTTRPTLPPHLAACAALALALGTGAALAPALAIPAATAQQPAEPAVPAAAGAPAASGAPAVPVPARETVPALQAPVTGPPTAAILHVDGGFSPHARWLWFDGDGTARLRGMLVEGAPGQFKSHLAFASVRTLLEDARACGPNVGRSAPILGNDVLHYRLDVRCGNAWRVVRDLAPVTAETPDALDMRKIVHGLEALAAKLTWAPADDDVALPDVTPLFRFAAPAG